MTPGFESVAATFADVARTHERGGLAFSATVDGTTVVDLCAGEAAPDRPWTTSTATCTMSVAKAFAGLVAAMLVDRGALEVDAPVTAYWPEFGRHGKEVVTVRQVLLHQAGVIGLPDVGATLGRGAEAWTDLDAIARALEDTRPAWEPGTRFGYHAITYGWLLGELVRRTDGRTLGTFFREEVATPLGVTAAIGIGDAAFRDLATTYPEGATTGGPPVMRLLMRRSKLLARQRDSLLGQAFLGDGTTSVLERAPALLADPAWFRAEIPSSNGVTSAHDLARVFCVMALGGEVDGHRFLSEETLALFAAPQLTELDVVMMSGFGPVLRPLVASRTRVTKTLGWAVNSPKRGWGPLGPSPRALGGAGMGGHLATADPDARVSTAFVRTDYSHSMAAQARLLKAFYSCLG